MNKNVSLIIPLLLLSSCGTPNENSSAHKIALITVGTTSSIEKAVRDEYAFDMLASGVSEMPLVSKSSKGEFSPCLASFSSNDSKTWTFTVKEGLTWSDGTPVTAEDILFSLIYESTEEAPAFTEGEKIGTYSSYSISTDKKSISLTLSSLSVKYLDSMTGFRVRPKHIYEGKKEEDISVLDARVTCGPYRLSSFDLASNSIIFVPNEYYPETPNVSRIVYKLFGAEDVMYSALKNGDLDYVWNYSMGVPSTYQGVLADASNIALESVTASNCPAVLTFNNARGLMSDENLRFAVSYALDYAKFKTLFGSPYASVPNRSFAPESLIGFKDTEALETNLEIADSYMQKSGYVKEGGVYQKSGTPASFKLTVNAGKAMHVQYAEVVKNELDAFGIQVELDSCDSAHYNEKTSHKFASEGSHEYGKITMEAAIFGYTAFGMANFGGMYINGNHAVQGGAEVYDEALNEAMDQLDKAETLEQYVVAAGKIQDFYAAHLPAIALYWDNLIYAHSATTTGFVLDGTFGLNNIATWFSITK